MIRKKKRYIRKHCFICGTSRMNIDSNFCSQNCYNKYFKFKKDKLRSEMIEHYSKYKIKKKWFQFWK